MDEVAVEVRVVMMRFGVGGVKDCRVGIKVRVAGRAGEIWGGDYFVAGGGFPIQVPLLFQIPVSVLASTCTI